MIILGVGVGVLAVVLIGLSVARKVGGDCTNFLVAGRTLALPLTAAGLMGQAVDTNATLGNTDLSAAGGFWAGASLPIGLALCLVLTGLFFAKRMNSMKLLTIGDFYRRRYGRGVEVAASLMMIFSFCILLAGNLVAGGFLFERFLGTSYAFGVLLIVGVVLVYTAAGVQRRVHRVCPDGHHRHRYPRVAAMGGIDLRNHDPGRDGPPRPRSAHQHRTGRDVQLGYPAGAGHRRHRRNRLHAADLRRPLPPDSAAGLLRRRARRPRGGYPVLPGGAVQQGHPG
jgi:hypothetical protein